MIPLGVGGIAVTVAAVVACWRGRQRAVAGSLSQLSSVVGVMVTYPIFFAGANESCAWRPSDSRCGPARSLGSLALDSDGTWDR